MSKGELRVESYGTIDELNAHLGFARSICRHEEIRKWTEEIQKMLFRVGSALATPPESKKPVPQIAVEEVDKLTEIVHQIEAREGILSDWSIPGAHSEASAYDIARTVCRRAERHIVRLMESGSAVDGQVIAYINRLSDVLWLFGRLLELEAGVDSRLREAGTGGPRWSRAW